jgi:peptide deformylase
VLRPILRLGDSILSEPARVVETITPEIETLIDDMIETMYAAPGVGLAAIQVGVPRRLVVLDVADEDEKPQPLVLFNPGIVALSSQTRVHEEGCLSIPDFRVEMDADGLLATAIQHEINHLDGKLIIDFLSPLKRDMVVRKFKKQARATT